jgi:pimeloyl-ACP methyl ester carboxylesterase
MIGMVLMHDESIFFGGWSLPPTLFRECFGPDYSYIDCNPLMPAFFDKLTILDRSWPEILKNNLSLSDSKNYKLAGWSTGAILAFALAALIPVTSLILISPTLSFCRREGYRHGTHPSVLRTMREHLYDDSDDVLSKFYRSCGFGDRFNPIKQYSPEQLNFGLHFLEQVNCTNMKVSIPNAIIIHGLDDAIIPHRAGEMVANACGSTVHTVQGGHAFFYNRESTIAKYINQNKT